MFSGFLFLAEREQPGWSVEEEQPDPKAPGFLQAGPRGEAAPVVNGRRQCVRFFYERIIMVHYYVYPEN